MDTEASGDRAGASTGITTAEHEIQKFLQQRGLEFKVAGEDLQLEECKFCIETFGDSKPWKLGIRRTDGVFHCFRCRTSGVWAEFRSRHGDRGQQSSSSVVSRQDYIRRQAKRIFDEAIDPKDPGSELLRRYFRERGLSSEITYQRVRFHPGLAYESGDIYPAIISSVTDVADHFLGIHRIFLSGDGLKAPVPEPKMVLGSFSGGAIRLGPTADEISLGEGIETIAAVHQATGMASWSTICAHGMETIKLPPQVSTVYIWADLDRSGTGQLAAENLARRLFSEGRKVFVLTPPGPIPDGRKSIDWLDVYVASPRIVSDARVAARQWSPPRIAPLQEAAWPKPIAEDAFHGVIGEIVDLILPTSEIDPVSLLVQFLAAYGNAVGRRAHYVIDSDRHGTNIFVTLVGKTARARKGTSWGHVRALMREVIQDFDNGRWASGLSSGEGLIAHVRDPIIKKGRKKSGGKPDDSNETPEDVVDEGVTDKRLLITESEFASVLKVCSRAGNILSTVLRDAWDGNRPLRNMVKNNPLVATDPHISLIGHITLEELRSLLTDVDIHNGTANRFLWVCVNRSKKRPYGGRVDAKKLSSLAWKLREIFEIASSVDEIRMDEQAHAMWAPIYDQLTEDKPGRFGNLIARSEPQVIRLSCIYALLDGASLIRPEHLKAALAVWEYCEASCQHICGDLAVDPIAQKILDFVRENPGGVSRTRIREKLSNHASAERLDVAFASLASDGLLYSQRKLTGGKPAEVWFAKQ